MDESGVLHLESYDLITHEPQSGVEITVYQDDAGKKVSAIG
jgi:hypothetical protein